MTNAVFEQLGPSAGERVSLELCPCLLPRLPSLCCASACNAFQPWLRSEGKQSPAVPRPNWTSKVRGREAEKQKDTGAEAAGCERDHFAFRAVQLFLHSFHPPLFTSPPQTWSLPCQEYTLVKRSEKSGLHPSYGNKRHPLLYFLCSALHKALTWGTAIRALCDWDKSRLLRRMVERK